MLYYLAKGHSWCSCHGEVWLSVPWHIVGSMCVIWASGSEIPKMAVLPVASQQTPHHARRKVSSIHCRPCLISFHCCPHYRSHTRNLLLSLQTTTNLHGCLTS
ncbi:uncharacterized protein EI90DRAFT_3073509 [Cantharellus anzutake]|uniref:uncharacterized protein n=1 Tax=Cantharellus anzutake TaxID=1750568 RepID=UPI0019079409|nr:uncharacterized protein EI90DRAFT_3073509 [Cantharellus anzutake]KAF8325236.1 hypothetical protein EI90DRAFT_3073509 [Cantharellus anzutake]